MAINMKDYELTDLTGLYKSKEKHDDGYKYVMFVKHEGKIIKRVLGYSKKDRLTTDRIAYRKLNDILSSLDTNKYSGIKLDKLFAMYIEDCPQTAWTKKKHDTYEKHIKSVLGKYKAEEIKPMHIKKIMNKMSSLAPRTRNMVNETLSPMYEFAIKNKILKENPAKDVREKVPDQKREVLNASELFTTIYNGIMKYYFDNPFYRAMFLFGFTGRRKGEVLSLAWEQVDLKNDYYWLDKTKTGKRQKFPLPPIIKAALLELHVDGAKGLVFPSPVTGKKISKIDRQFEALKKFMGIEVFHFHYMRNVLVSALAENNVEAIILSGILGHNDVNTINKYLSQNHYNAGVKGQEAIAGILASSNHS